MPITPFVRHTSFDPEAVAAMGIAFENALQELGLSDRQDPLTAIVAQKIICAAAAGERDPARLCDRAVKDWDGGPG